MITPHGIGAYHRRIAGTSPSEIRAAVTKAQDAGITWIALMAEAMDGYRNPIGRLETWGGAFRDAGIEPWVWTFPGKAGPGVDQREYADALRLAWLATGARGVILDVESPHKGRPGPALELRNAVLDVIPSDHGCGFSSFGIRSMHPSIPWEVFAHPRIFGSPQFYTVAPHVAEGSIKTWQTAHVEIVPNLPCYEKSRGATGAMLDEYFRDLAVDRFPAVCMWSWPDLDRGHVRTLRKWSERFPEAKACRR
jgi:hypothetical protein